MFDEMTRFGFGGMFFLISNLLLLGTTLAAEECPYKQCSCGMEVIMCNELGLTTMPQLNNTRNTYFTVAQFMINNITNVPTGSLPANLSQLSFVRNPIATIDASAFDESANTLTSIEFFEANFVKLPDAFLHLNVLSFFTIGDSNVGDWNDGAMKKIGASLNTLSISNVQLNTWPSWMQHFTNLTDLSISGASLSDIPDNGLDSLINTATNIELSNNSFTSIPKAVSKMVAVKFLGFQDNKISDVAWLPQKCQLTGLSIFNNRLYDSKQLSTVILPYTKILTQIELRGNQLTSFPELGNFTLIDELDFRRNKLVDPNAGSLPLGLVDLKLGNNNLPRLPRFMTVLKSITQLYVGSNSITELEAVGFPPETRGAELQDNLIWRITDTSFPVNSSITYVLLNGNPLVTFTEQAFKNLPQLVELQLKDTRLNRMPLGLLNLSKLDTFDISNTATLVCTCQEKSLRNWVLKIGEGGVVGTCGVSTVYYFFNIMCPQCPDARGLIEEEDIPLA